MKNTLPSPPIVEVRPHRLLAHGHERTDPYFWLNDRDDPAVLAYLEAENDYLTAGLKSVASLQKTLYTEIRGRIHEADMSAPYLDRGYWYYSRFDEGSEYPVYARRLGSMQAPEQLLLDVNVLAIDQEFIAVRGLQISPDNKTLLYFVDTVGRRMFEMHIRDIATGVEVSTGIDDASPNGVWSTDSQHIVFVRQEEGTLRSNRVQRFGVGDRRCHDLFEEGDDTFSVYVDKARSEKFILIVSVSTVSTEVRLLSSDALTDPLVVFWPRSRDHEYFVDHDGQFFYVCTNLGAKNFELRRAPSLGMAPAEWEVVVAHRDDVLLDDFLLFERFIVTEQMRAGLRELEVINRITGDSYVVAFNDEAYAAGVGDNCDYFSSTLRYEYESMNTPDSVYDYDLDDRGATLIKQDKVLGDFDPDDYQTQRLSITARDGTEVPVSLVRKIGASEQEAMPLLLYAYGSYGYNIEPGFSYARLSLLDRGFVFAIAHVRGGSDLGRAWYEDGKLAKKKNTFNDFIDVGRALVKRGITKHDRLYAMGGSAGGLLMGVVVNEAPDDYAGVVAAVPFVDVVTTMLDDTIPLTTGEYDEWGDPRDPDAYKTILSYSPYDNVVAKDYPNLLVTTGLHDSQVQYWEPAKWVAKLRQLKTDDNLLLLHTNMDAGHGGASGRFESIREVAREYSFLLLLESSRQDSTS